MSAEAPQTAKLSGDDGPASPRLTRMRTNTAEIDSTITHPGSVKINVKGAFIVDQDSGSPNGSYATEHAHTNGGNHDTKDIRLPNHTAVVSHIAVDVRLCFPLRHIGVDVGLYFTLPIQRIEERRKRDVDRDNR
jgi:type II pantothenate kinase